VLAPGSGTGDGDSMSCLHRAKFVLSASMFNVFRKTAELAGIEPAAHAAYFEAQLFVKQWVLILRNSRPCSANLGTMQRMRPLRTSFERERAISLARRP